MNHILTASAFAIAAIGASDASAAALVSFGNPWGEISTVEAAMDSAFGAGSWTDVETPADASFLSGEDIVYFEGSDDTANAMEDFLTAFTSEISAFIAFGGSVFINAAPNQGDGFDFLGMSTDRGLYCNLDCAAVDPAHDIFDGIVSSYSGSAFSHGTVSGGTSLIEDDAGNSLLSYQTIGNGLLTVGTMTTTNFHIEADAQQLRANILTWAASGPTPLPPPVPLPASLPLLLAGLAGLKMVRGKRV